MSVAVPWRFFLTQSVGLLNEVRPAAGKFRKPSIHSFHRVAYDKQKAPSVKCPSGARVVFICPICYTTAMSNDRNNAAIILASASPRRRYLLRQAGLSVEVIPSDFDEESVTESDPAARVERLATAKADRVALSHPDRWVIGADTVVVIDGKILGKPASGQEARKMLRRLAGRTHQVYTGYAVLCAAKHERFCGSVCTDVRFKELNEPEIAWYVSTGEPFDKAGAYAIQGIGTFLVKSINGSYTNVVGLPVCEVIELLIKEGVVGWTPNGLN